MFVTRPAAFLSFLLTCSLAPAAEVQSRIRSAIENNQTVVLNDNTPRVVSRGAAIDQGAVSRSQTLPRMVLHFTMTAPQQADLDQLLEAQQDRHSPNYHKFLSPEQYADRFGLNTADIEKVSRWLENSGFHNLQVARSRSFIRFSGNAGQAESAFHTSIHRYLIRGEQHWANESNPRLPKAMEGLVDSVRGLNNIPLRPNAIHLHPEYSSGLSQHFMAPYDWATIYDVQPLYTAGLDGSGVTIAIVGQSDVQMTDIQAFRSAAGLSLNNPNVIVPPGDPDPGFQLGDETESDLDLEWAGGIAKNATILFVTSGNGVEAALAYAIDNNVAPIVSESYSQCEPQETTSDFNYQTGLLQQAVAQGMTIVASSGDTGAAACDQGLTETAATLGLAVNFPASSQYVTGIGGTEFSDGGGSYWNGTTNSVGGSALSYIPEIVWNDAFQLASGGGVSTLVTKPTWQTGTGVPADGARDVPDVSFSASSNHDQYIICESNSCTNGFLNSSRQIHLAGGTSASAPSFAGLLALVIQQNGVSTRLGNINPNLYSLAQTSPNAFHDITSGGNEQACSSGTPNCPIGTSQIGYTATAGYDLATGLGSIDGYNFAQQWYGDFQIAATPATVTVQPGASATTTISVTPQNNFSGNVTFTCSVSSNLIGVTCSVPSTPVGPSGSAVVTISASSSARIPAPWRRRFPGMPPGNSPWLWLLAVPLALLPFASRRLLSARMSPLYAGSMMALLVIAAGAVSCGGGGATTAIASGPSATLTISCTTPPVGTVGAAYNDNSCTAHGGTAPYGYSLSGSSLPPGLSLSTTTGVISGTPTAAGSYQFFLQVYDAGTPAQFATSTTQTIYVGSATPTPLNVSCTLPTAISDSYYYNAKCTATGGAPSYSFTISAGALPAGLTLATNGQITGTPITAGTSSFTVSASDSGPSVGLPLSTGSVTYNKFVVVPGTLSVYCSGNTMASAGIAYNNQCTALSGTIPYSYSITSGTLPAGLSLNASSGLISGIPTTAGSYSFAVKAVDSGTPAQTAAETINLFLSSYQALSVQCFLVGTAQLGSTYNGGSCMGFGGTLPYTFALTNAPPGLTIGSKTGSISGMPTQLGTFPFSVQITDSEVPPVTASQAQTLTVGPRASETGTVTITATSGGITNTTTINVTVP